VMQGVLAAAVVVIGTLAVTIGVWTINTKASWFQVRNACLWGTSGVGATIILLLAAELVRDEVFTIATLIILSFIVFFIGRSLNQV
jgi:hypothetical protein